MCKGTTFEVLDCELENILDMPFLRWFNLENDWTTGDTTIDRYIIPLVENEDYTSNLRLEITFAKAFVKGFKQGKYTWCGYIVM